MNCDYCKTRLAIGDFKANVIDTENRIVELIISCPKCCAGASVSINFSEFEWEWYPD